MRKMLAAIAAVLTVSGSASAQAKLSPPEEAGGAYFEFVLGLHLESMGDAAGATAAYQRAEKLDPQSAEIPAALAELYARMNKPTDAIAAGERAVKADPASPEANWILGSLYARMIEMPTTRDADRQTYALRAAESLTKANTNAHPGAPVMLGRMYLATRQFAKAISLLAPLVVDEPDNTQAVALLADAYQAADRDVDAVALLERSVEVSPELYGTLAEVYESSGRWREAARAYEGAVEDAPTNISLRSQWATALLRAGDAQRAREVLEQGSTGSGRNTRALYLLAEAQRRTKDLVAAEITARRLIAVDPKSLAGSLELALIYRDQKEHQKIVALLEPIVTARFRAADASEMADETFRSVYFDLATAYEDLKQYDKAIGILTQARTLSPTDPAVVIRLARAQVNAGKGDSALTTLQGAVAKMPDEPALQLELASALERQKKFGDAEAVFRKMIAEQPSDANALNSFGYMLAERGQKLDEAVSFVERALKLDPGNPAYLDSLGWAYYKQGQYDRAEPPLREAAEKLPTVSVIQSHLGDALLKRGLYQDAIDAWQRAIDGDGDAVSRSELDDKIKSARQRLGKKK
ncbi:MAG: tetratricopeptide repeat protein [Vicinamibacterales bacterium]|nr:tetratricopeptide repeat protein [Vicinamibacterales bacterium]